MSVYSEVECFTLKGLLIYSDFCLLLPVFQHFFFGFHEQKFELTHKSIMQDDSSSKWDDVVFIPPGFDVATGQSRR